MLIGTRRGYWERCTAFVLGLESSVVYCGCCSIVDVSSMAGR